MTLTDTHCHLNFEPLSHDTAAVQARARARDVTNIIVPAYDRLSWEQLAKFASTPNLFVAYGIHPWLAHEMPTDGQLDEAMAALAGCLDAGNPVAVGEIGLDTKIDQSGVAEQMPLFEAQLQLAVDRDLPVILHCRGAFEEMLTAIANHGGKLRGVLHAFSRGPDLGHRFLEAGMHVAFGGSITRPTAKRPRKAALRLPLDRIVLETDAPGLGLHNVPNLESEPHHVADVAIALAAIRGEPLYHIAAVTTANARALFHLPAPEGDSTP